MFDANEIMMISCRLATSQPVMLTPRRHFYPILSVFVPVTKADFLKYLTSTIVFEYCASVNLRPI